LIRKTIAEDQGNIMILLIVGSGLTCAAMLAFGFGFVVPVSGAVGDVCDLVAVGSGILFVGLLDSK